MRQRLRRKDLLWVLAYPVYQVLGSFRHEASHAICALMQGGEIREFVPWPAWTPNGFYWGYVRWSGDVGWLATAAPYLCDLITFAVFFFVCTRVSFRRHWVWVNLVAIGLISPLVNSAYNYISGVRGAGDVALLLNALPDPAVHACFVTSALLYLVGLVWVLKPRVRAGTEKAG